MLQCRRTRPVVFISSLLLAAILLSQAFAAEETSLLKNQPLIEAYSTMGEEEYFGELKWWADDERGGREPGTQGSIQAGERAASDFARLNLKPVGDTIDGKPTYFQYLDRGGKKGIMPGHRLAVGRRIFEMGREWSLLGGCDEVSLEGVEVVFAGYGITAPEYGYDDYREIDVKGKVILIIRYEPEEKDKESEWNGDAHTQHSFFNNKLENAEKHGALAVLFVDGPLHHNPDKDPLSSLSTRAGRNKRVPMIHVRRTIADSLLRRAGTTLSKVQKRIDGKGTPASMAIPGVHLDLIARVGSLTRARNVIGLLEGTDPSLKDEVVIVGAHYDHIGMGSYGVISPSGGGKVYNGADDNASGSVGVVELAEAFVEGGLKPRRSILFQLYDAEEKGLLGSRHYVSNPVFPLKKTSAMLNMDMIGRVRNKRCSIMATGTAKEWGKILTAAEEGSPLEWAHLGGGWGGSDQSSFLREDIPVLFFNSGMHEHLHHPDDDAERCNPEGAVDVLKVVLKTLLLVANRDEKLTFQEPSRTSAPKAKLGISVGRPDGGVEGIKITALSSGGGAQKAGLQKGDVITALGTTPVKNTGELRDALRKQKPGDVVKVKILRKDDESEVDVILGD